MAFIKKKVVIFLNENPNRPLLSLSNPLKWIWQKLEARSSKPWEDQHSTDSKAFINLSLKWCMEGSRSSESQGYPQSIPGQIWTRGLNHGSYRCCCPAFCLCVKSRCWGGVSIEDVCDARSLKHHHIAEQCLKYYTSQLCEPVSNLTFMSKKCDRNTTLPIIHWKSEWNKVEMPMFLFHGHGMFYTLW